VLPSTPQVVLPQLTVTDSPATPVPMHEHDPDPDPEPNVQPSFTNAQFPADAQDHVLLSTPQIDSPHPIVAEVPPRAVPVQAQLTHRPVTVSHVGPTIDPAQFASVLHPVPESVVDPESVVEPESISVLASTHSPSQ
jgi:hypothetical protein